MGITCGGRRWHFLLGLADDGVEYPGLPWEVSEQLLEYILPKWVRE